MKAIVKMHLVKPTRSGRTVDTQNFIGKNIEVLKKQINEFIFSRVNKSNYIKVVRFECSIHKGNPRFTDCSQQNCIESWNYTPTYQ